MKNVKLGDQGFAMVYGKPKSIIIVGIDNCERLAKYKGVSHKYYYVELERFQEYMDENLDVGKSFKQSEIKEKFFKTKKQLIDNLFKDL